MITSPGLLKTLLAFGITCSGAIAATVTYSFGTLDGATFGGSGIPNQNVAITTIVDGTRTITLGLTATQRYSNPAVTNTGLDSDYDGTFYAIAGGDTFSGRNSNANYARWNISYDVDYTPDINGIFNFLAQGYSISLMYDGKNPAFGNIPLSTASTQWGNDPGNSLNLGMGAFSSGGAFDPNATGEYSFALVLKKHDIELGRSSINVIVGSGTPPAQPTSAPVPDAGTSVALLGLSLSALVGIKRKLK